MDSDTATRQASETPQDAWAVWQREHVGVMARAAGPQRILLEAAVKFVAVIAAQPVLLRIAASTTTPIPPSPRIRSTRALTPL